MGISPYLMADPQTKHSSLSLSASRTRLWQLYRHGRFRELVEVAEELLKFTNDVEVRRALGFGYDQLSLRTDSPRHRAAYQRKAQRTFEGLVADCPKATKALRGLALAFLHRNQLGQALRTYKKAHRLKKHETETMIGLGNVYRALGRPRLAVHWYAKCLSVDNEGVFGTALANLNGLFRDRFGKGFQSHCFKCSLRSTQL